MVLLRGRNSIISFDLLCFLYIIFLCVEAFFLLLINFRISLICEKSTAANVVKFLACTV
jgi:hypothetical protein